MLRYVYTLSALGRVQRWLRLYGMAHLPGSTGPRLPLLTWRDSAVDDSPSTPERDDDVQDIDVGAVS